VPDAWGDVKVQDLVDTLSAKQAELDALVYDALLDIPDTSGKQVLSATKSVGITCVSIRAQVKFEDLPGPSYTIKRITDGNFVSIDNEADRNQIEEMANSTFVNWKTEADVSAALLNPDISAAVWDVPQADHVDAGTTGESLDDAAAKAALAAALAASQ